MDNLHSPGGFVPCHHICMEKVLPTSSVDEYNPSNNPPTTCRDENRRKHGVPENFRLGHHVANKRQCTLHFDTSGQNKMNLTKLTYQPHQSVDKESITAVSKSKVDNGKQVFHSLCSTENTNVKATFVRSSKSDGPSQCSCTPLTGHQRQSNSLNSDTQTARNTDVAPLHPSCQRHYCPHNNIEHKMSSNERCTLNSGLTNVSSKGKYSGNCVHTLNRLQSEMAQLNSTSLLAGEPADEKNHRKSVATASCSEFKDDRTYRQNDERNVPLSMSQPVEVRYWCLHIFP